MGSKAVIDADDYLENIPETDVLAAKAQAAEGDD